MASTIARLRTHIGCRYYGVPTIRRTHNGTYEEVLPECDAFMQTVLLHKPVVRPPFLIRLKDAFLP